MGPLGKIGERYVDATIFGCASLQGADRIESDGAALKAEVERLSGCADDARGTSTNQRIVGSFRPFGYRPPGAIQLLHLFEVGAGDDHRMAIGGAGNGISEGNCDAAAYRGQI